MFDKHIHQRSTVMPVTKETRIISRDVSPDKMAEIYKKAYEQAQSDVLKTYIVKTELVEFVFVERCMKMSSLALEYATCIRINGQDIELRIEKKMGIDETPVTIAEHFVQKFGEYLGHKMVIEHVTQFNRPSR